MHRNLIVLIVAVATLFAFSSPALAENETFDDSKVEFLDPTSLDALTTYDFQMLVYNNALPTREKGDWINQVDLTLPSTAYNTTHGDISIPEPLHYDVISYWEVAFAPSTGMISWQAVGVVSSATFGDIREGEYLMFEFRATTDDQATDGFEWVLYSDMGNMVTGTTYIMGGDDDDNDNNNDDDDDRPFPDDDDEGRTDDELDEETTGCGC